MIGLIFPHQLFEDLAPWRGCNEVYLIEEYLFFRQYNFHQQKIVYHRASMKFYLSYLQANGISARHMESTDMRSDIRNLLSTLAGRELRYIDPVDNWLEKRIAESCAASEIKRHKLPSPGFLNSEEELADYLRGRDKLFQTDFYKKERIKRDILLDEAEKPQGGQWTFDADNRLEYPKNKLPPVVAKPAAKICKYGNMGKYGDAVIF